MKIIVTRAFLLAGVRQEEGSEIDLDDRGLLGLLIHAGKARPAQEAPPQRGPMTTETVGGLVSGKPATGKPTGKPAANSEKEPQS